VLACGASPRYGRLDPGAMAAAAIDEALRNAVAVGADPDHAAILDNFSWGNCDKPEQLGALVLAAKACYETALAFRTPFVSGKDSLNNEYRVGERSLSIPPTLLVTCLARIDDVRRAVTMDLKRAGNPLYLVGLTRAELGGSHYLGLLGLEGGVVPRPDDTRSPRLLHAMHAAIRGGAVRASHDLSEGGLLVAAAEMALAGDLGARLELAAVPAEGLEARHDPDAVRAFSQSCTRFLVEVEAQRAPAFERSFTGLPLARVGLVSEAPVLEVRGVGGAVLAALPTDSLRRAFLDPAASGGAPA
jgi:phosphoribosylformylglycinamidine synthase